MKSIEKIKTKASTGLFTDYFDEIGQEYIFIGNLVLNNSRGLIFGRCRTILCESGPFKDENIELGLGYLDKCVPGDVLIVSGGENFAYFGELMSRLALARELSGAIILGATRDTRFTGDYLTIAAKSYTPVDIKGRGRVVDTGCSFTYQNNVISEDMYVVADNDGAIFFQHEKILDLLDKLSTIIDHEATLIEKIESGHSVKEILKFTKSF